MRDRRRRVSPELLCALVCSFTGACTTDHWQRLFGEPGSASGVLQGIDESGDGGYLAAGGGTAAPGDPSRMQVVKIDHAGTQQWIHTYPAVEGGVLSAIRRLSDGSFIACGGSPGTGQPDTQVVVLGIDANGDELWRTGFGDAQGHHGHCLGMVPTLDGGIVLAGPEYGTTSASIVVAKLDADHHLEWARSLGGIGDGAIAQHPDGHFVVGVGNPECASCSLHDMQLVHLDAHGDEIARHSYPNAGSDIVGSVSLTDDGGALLVGQTWGPMNFDTLRIVRTDATGAELWARTVTEFAGFSGNLTASGGYVFVGAGKADYDGQIHDVFLLETDGDGNTQWMNHYGGLGQDWGYKVQQTPDGGFVVPGSFQEGYTSRMFVIKTDALGDAGLPPI